MLRVGFDGRDLLRKRTGVVNNTLHLARELTRTHRGEVMVYVDDPADVPESPPRDVPTRRLSGPTLAWKHALLPLALLRDHRQVFHSPTGTLPLWAPCKQVVTIHDLFAAVEPACSCPW